MAPKCADLAQRCTLEEVLRVLGERVRLVAHTERRQRLDWGHQQPQSPDGGSQTLALDERSILAAQLVEQRVDGVFGAARLEQQLGQLRVLGCLLNALLQCLERLGLEPACVDAELL